MKSNSSPPLQPFGLEESQPIKASDDTRVIDAISAVIAVDGSRPLAPESTSLDAIREKIAFSRKPRRSLWPLLFAGSGWAAAIAIGLSSLSQQNTSPTITIADPIPQETPNTVPTLPQKAPHAPAATDTIASDTMPQNGKTDVTAQSETMRSEQRSLIQEISTLRDRVKFLQQRDNQRSSPADGVMWPIIVKMSKPGEEQVDLVVNDSILGSMMKQLGSQDPNAPEVAAIDVSPPANASESPVSSAIPIYDPARDNGQLMVNNLPSPGANQSYYLWVDTDESEEPVLVGALPPDLNTTSETFQFKLGSTGVIPTSFRITLDSLNAAAAPSTNNTVLQGPK